VLWLEASVVAGETLIKKFANGERGVGQVSLVR
jgi:hypothetical protein